MELTEKQLERKILQIIFESTGKLDMENKMKDAGIDPIYAKYILHTAERLSFMIKEDEKYESRIYK